MNNQQITKILNYFRINHGFHSPFTFLIDGNFLKLLVQKDINLQQRLKPVVPGKVRLKVTNCTVTQLEMLGHDFTIICKKAKEMQIIKCSHTFQSVDRCIFDNSDTEKNLIVCSQDKILRRRLRYRNIGIMYFGPDQRITMEDIQRHELQNAKQAEREKFMPAPNQRQELEQYRQQQDTLEKLKKRREQFKLASTRGIQLKYIKKKVAKGPNPLSVRKRHNKHDEGNPNKQSNQKACNQQQGQAEVQKKKRIRKRNKNKTKAATHPNDGLDDNEQNDE